METNLGERRGSYLWGRSVHNVRIERLWVDVTAQVGATWAELFTLLEIRHGLDINNPQHIWLLHFLFLGTINQQLDFFTQSWNQHRIQIRGGPNRSPADMFGFDMIVHGIRGYQLPRLDDSIMTEEELEVFGMDWEGLREDNLLQSREANNPRNEDSGSWLGRVGPPEHLNEVPLHAPQDVFTPEELRYIDQTLLPRAGAVQDLDASMLWTEGLALAKNMYPDLF
ncbi:hypothetical protein FPV67DRAFT_1428128 [Lyophyllum atratum]|nr:hypothetical protein FPV67DRAFT_1428128 [Lyophyllum atratum]